MQVVDEQSLRKKNSISASSGAGSEATTVAADSVVFRTVTSTPNRTGNTTDGSMDNVNLSDETGSPRANESHIRGKRFRKCSDFTIFSILIFLFHADNGEVIVTLLPVNEQLPWITPAKFRPELVPEELMAPVLTVS